METENYITGNTEDEIWQQIGSHFQQNPDLLEYNTTIVLNDRKVALAIDIDLGGGFESGSSSTSLVAALPAVPPFRFAVHEQHFIDEVGKFFGMEDVVIGYKDFDDKLIIKTNKKAAVRKLFASPLVRETILTLSDFTLALHHHTKEGIEHAYLELFIEDAITDVAILRKIYSAFYAVLEAF